MIALPIDVDGLLMRGLPSILQRQIRARLAQLAVLFPKVAPVEAVQNAWLGAGNLAELLVAASNGADPERPDFFLFRSQADVALIKGAKARFPFLPALLAIRADDDPLSQVHDEVTALVIAGCLHLAIAWGVETKGTIVAVTSAARAVEQLAKSTNNNLLATVPSMMRPLPVLQALFGYDQRKDKLIESLKDQRDVANWLANRTKSEPRKQLNSLIGKLRFEKTPIYAPNRGAGVLRSRLGKGEGTSANATEPTIIKPLSLRTPLPHGPKAFQAFSDIELPPLQVRMENGGVGSNTDTSDDIRPKIESPPNARRHLKSNSVRLHRTQANAMARDMARRDLHLPCEAATATPQEARELVQSLIELNVEHGSGAQSDEGNFYTLCALCLGCMPSTIKFQRIENGEHLEGFVRLQKDRWAYQRGVKLPTLIVAREITDLLCAKPKPLAALELPPELGAVIERFLVRKTGQAGFDLTDPDAIARSALKRVAASSTRAWTLGRVSNVLSATLHQVGADRAHAAWILGERPMDAPPTHYSRLSVDQIMKTYGRALELFWASPQTTASNTVSCVGSSIILQDQALAAFLKFLGETVEKTETKAHSDFTQRHNRRALHCYLTLALATGHRPVKSPFERVQDFDFDAGWIVIDDKAIGRASARLVPLCPTSLSSARGWQAYLEAIAQSQIMSKPEIAKRAADALSGERPFFFLVEGDAPAPLEPKSIQDIMRPTLPLPPNWARHAVSTALRQTDLDPDIIDACLGHDGLSVGHQSRHSILSHQQLQGFAAAVETWFEKLGISEAVAND
jgi:hypothetical protein